MSYREENGQVVLTMSRGEYECLLIVIGMATGAAMGGRGLDWSAIVALLNRLNEGNPNYTPYEVQGKPHSDTLCTCGRKYYEHRESGYKHAALKLDHAFRARS